MNKAHHIKKIDGPRVDQWASLYRMDPPLDGHEFVVVSAVRNSFIHETFIFPADEEGEIIDWGELEGSMRDTTDHAKSLESAGYVIVESDK